MYLHATVVFNNLSSYSPKGYLLPKLMYYSVCTLDFDLLTASCSACKARVATYAQCLCSAQSGSFWRHFIVSLLTGATSFQGVRLERLHCIQRHLYVLLKRGYKLLLLGHTHPHEAHQVRLTLSNRDVDERVPVNN